MSWQDLSPCIHTTCAKKQIWVGHKFARIRVHAVTLLLCKSITSSPTTVKASPVPHHSYQRITSLFLCCDRLNLCMISCQKHIFLDCSANRFACSLDSSVLWHLCLISCSSLWLCWFVVQSGGHQSEIPQDNHGSIWPILWSLVCQSTHLSQSAE